MRQLLLDSQRLAELLGYHFEVMVNGDDLRIVLFVSRNEIPHEKLGEHLVHIAKDFGTNYAKFGFKLKLQETYYSSTLLGFGKVYTEGGIFSQQTLTKEA